MVVVLSKAPRGPGAVSFTRNVSARIGPDSTYILTLLMDAADLADASLTFTVRLEGNPNPTGASGWVTLAESPWTGGHQVVDKSGNTIMVPPILTYQTDAAPPVRIRMGSPNLPRQLNLGLDIVELS